MSYTQANLWWLDLWFGPMMVDLWWDLWYQTYDVDLWYGPMIDDFDDLPPAAIVAMKFVAGSKLRFSLSTWRSELKCDIKLELATSTWNFNLQFDVTFWFRNSISNLNFNERLRSLIWNVTPPHSIHAAGMRSGIHTGSDLKAATRLRCSFLATRPWT